MHYPQSNDNTEPAAALARGMIELLDRLARIEATMAQLLNQRTVKEWYTTDEVAELLGKAPFTVREWCRNGRVNATKRKCGRGVAKEWTICHEELRRIQNDGLLEEVAPYRHPR